MEKEEVLKKALQNIIHEIVDGCANFLKDSNVAAVATLFTLLSFAVPIIIKLVKFFMNQRALVKQEDKVQIQGLIEAVCEICMSIGAILIFFMFLEIDIYVIGLAENISNKFLYAIFLIVLLTMSFILFKYGKHEHEKGYLWITCNIVFFGCVTSFCIGGIVEHINENNIIYLYSVEMLMTGIYSLLILFKYEKEWGIFLHKGNKITCFLSSVRYIILFMFMSCIFLSQECTETIVYVCVIWIIITYINWIPQIKSTDKKQGGLVFVEMNNEKLVSTSNIRRTWRGMIFIITQDNEQYFLNKEDIICISYDKYNTKQVGCFQTKWVYRLKTKNVEETREGEADVKKFINQDWVKFEKYELLKKSVVLVPMENIQYIKCANR